MCEAYFAGTEILRNYRFAEDVPPKNRDLILAFCRGIFESRSKGAVANHVLPFVCRANERWDIDWAPAGKTRGHQYAKEAEQWKNSGLELLRLNVFPLVDCPALGLNASHARNFALSALFNVLGKLDSTRSSMLRWIETRRQLEAELAESEEEMRPLHSQYELFAAALHEAMEVGYVQINGRLLRNWQNYRRRRPFQETYRSFFDELTTRGVADHVSGFLRLELARGELSELRTPEPRLPGIDYDVDLHLGIGTSIYIKPDVNFRDITRPRGTRQRTSYQTFVFTLPLLRSNEEEKTHTVEGLMGPLQAGQASHRHAQPAGVERQRPHGRPGRF